MVTNRSEYNKDSIEMVSKNLKAATYGLHRAYKQNPLSGDNLEKIESDRYRFYKRLIFNKLSFFPCFKTVS
jgi:hypothetical protein